MTRTREENATDLQLEDQRREAAGDLADADLFQCVECEAVLDIDESVLRNEALICELCEEQLKASSASEDSCFFGVSFSKESFHYLSEDPDSHITPEQIAEGVAKAEAAFRDNHYRIKEQFFEFVLDLCESCIWDAGEESTNG